MKFAGYDRRVCVKVPWIGTNKPVFGVIVAGRYTLQRLPEHLSVVFVCLTLRGV